MMSPFQIILGCVDGFEMGTDGSEAKISTLGTMNVESFADASTFFSTNQVLFSSKCPSTFIR